MCKKMARIAIYQIYTQMCKKFKKNKKMARIAIYQMDLHLHLHVAGHATNAYLGMKLDKWLKNLPG